MSVDDWKVLYDPKYGKYMITTSTSVIDDVNCPSKHKHFNCQFCGAPNQVDVCEYCGSIYEGDNE